MKKKKIIEKVFNQPFVAEPDYYKKYSHEDVLNKVKKDIDTNFYILVRNADDIEANYIKSVDSDWLNRNIKHLVHSCPNLFKSDNLGARRIVAHFGNLSWTALYASNPNERRKAKSVIDNIFNRHFPVTNIPPYLSLRDMFNYLHEITKYLKKRYVENIGHEPIDFHDNKEIATIRAIDERLVEIAKNGKLDLLLARRPEGLTRVVMAEFFCLKEGSLSKYLKSEKKTAN